MIDFTCDEAGMKAYQEYKAKVMALYEQCRRDSNNPNEYIGLDDEEKELERFHINVENEILLNEIERYVEDSYLSKPYATFVYKDGEYKFSLFGTIKSIVQYYLKKWRKRDFCWKGKCVKVEKVV